MHSGAMGEESILEESEHEEMGPVDLTVAMMEKTLIAKDGRIPVSEQYKIRYQEQLEILEEGGSLRLDELRLSEYENSEEEEDEDEEKTNETKKGEQFLPLPLCLLRCAGGIKQHWKYTLLCSEDMDVAPSGWSGRYNDCWRKRSRGVIDVLSARRLYLVIFSL